MRKSFAFAGLLLCMFGVAIYAEVLYTNDFGTAQQFNALTWESLSGAGVSNLYREGAGSGPNPPGDMDGDGLYEGVVQDAGGSWGSSAGEKIIYAPLFKTMSNITLSGYGRGDWGNWTSGARWRIGYDGDNWSHMVQTDSNTAWHYKSVNTGSDPNYIDTDKVWVRVEVVSNNNNMPSGSWGRTGGLQVEADVQDGQIGDRVSIMLNDFGTEAQRSDWIVSGFLNFVESGSAYDTDGDGLSAGLDATRPSDAIAMLRIDAPPGLAFKDPVARGRAYGAKTAYDSYAQLRLGTDGVNWDVASTFPSDPTWYDMLADATGESNFQAAETIWIQIRLYSYYNNYLPKARNVVVTAELVAGTPPYCGQQGTEYLPSDISGDCYVNIADLAVMASQWLECTNPADPDCQ